MRLTKPTVASVTKQFAKLITSLEEVAAAARRDIDDADIAIKEANDKKAEAEAEMTKAHSIVTKLNALLS